MAKTKRSGATSKKATPAITARLTPENVRWVSKEIAKTRQPIITVVNTALDAIREGKPYALSPFVSALARKVAEQETKRAKRYEKIAQADA
jgi:hypothetical protein